MQLCLKCCSSQFNSYVLWASLAFIVADKHAWTLSWHSSTLVLQLGWRICSSSFGYWDNFSCFGLFIPDRLHNVEIRALWGPCHLLQDCFSSCCWTDLSDSAVFWRLLLCCTVNSGMNCCLPTDWNFFAIMYTIHDISSDPCAAVI